MDFPSSSGYIEKHKPALSKSRSSDVYVRWDY